MLPVAGRIFNSCHDTRVVLGSEGGREGRGKRRKGQTPACTHCVFVSLYLSTTLYRPAFLPSLPHSLP